MGLQLIFVVETNKRTNSDWIYIKDTIEHFYRYERTQVKFSPVYMDGKGKYEKKEKEIQGLISQYASTSKTNQSKVIYCFDCDEYNKKPEDLAFLKEVKKYCQTKGYHFVWFCRDIEEVYLGQQIPDNQKKERSVSFKAKKKINDIPKEILCASEYGIGKSNLALVLNQFLS